jgi:hypothetical protein
MRAMRMMSKACLLALQSSLVTFQPCSTFHLESASPSRRCLAALPKYTGNILPRDELLPQLSQRIYITRLCFLAHWPLATWLFLYQRVCLRPLRLI